jgi:hypothetical protein
VTGDIGALPAGAEAGETFYRLPTPPTIGRLDRDAARSSLIEPVEAAEVAFADAAVGAIVEYTGGYPYF